MSHSNGQPAQPVRTGILVSVSGKPCKAIRPTLKQTPTPRVSTGFPRWPTILVAGTLVAVAGTIGIVLGIAWQGRSTGMEQASPWRANATIDPGVRPEMPERPPEAETLDTDVFEPEPISFRETSRFSLREVETFQAYPEPVPLSFDSTISNSMFTVNAPRIDKIAKSESQDGPPETDPDACIKGRQLGTDLRFLKDPPEAFRLAKTEKKLVFMLHLSGNFEDKEFT